MNPRLICIWTPIWKPLCDRDTNTVRDRSKCTMLQVLSQDPSSTQRVTLWHVWARKLAIFGCSKVWIRLKWSLWSWHYIFAALARAPSRTPGGPLTPLWERPIARSPGSTVVSKQLAGFWVAQTIKSTYSHVLYIRSRWLPLSLSLSLSLSLY